MRPVTFTESQVDIVKAICQKEPADRLPMLSGGVRNLKNHQWYKGFAWEPGLQRFFWRKCCKDIGWKSCFLLAVLSFDLLFSNGSLVFEIRSCFESSEVGSDLHVFQHRMSLERTSFKALPWTRPSCPRRKGSQQMGFCGPAFVDV